MVEKILPRAELELGTRSVGHCLTHRATRAPSDLQQYISTSKSPHKPVQMHMLKGLRHRIYICK